MTAITTLPDGLPELTLGWEVLDWMGTYIRQPDGDHAGDVFDLTDEQVRFVLWWYAITPQGRWLHIRGVLRRSKGWGKSPFVAALALAELCGPVRFGGFAEGGEWPHWRSKPYELGELMAVPTSAAWVQLAGVSERQTQNTMSVVSAMIAESPIVEDYGLDPGITRIYTAAGGKLEPITASASSAEGARPTFVVEDETHHWTDSNGGMKLDQVNRRNVGKIPGGTGRVLETTNAHAPGQGTVAEKSYEAHLAQLEGRTRSKGLLYDAREAPSIDDLGDEPELMAALADAYGDSTWVDLERIRDETYDPSTPPEDSRRFYLNQITAASDSWLAEYEWSGCMAGPEIPVPGDGAMITLGFDGSRGLEGKRALRPGAVADSTALIACRVSDGYTWPIHVWEQPEGPAGAGWKPPLADIEATLGETFTRFEVVGFFADPAKWEGVVAGWEAKYGKRLKVKATQANPISWWMTGSRGAIVVRALEAFHTAVLEGELWHNGASVLTRHVLNARRRAGRFGISIAKEHPESARKIDAAVAAVLAHEARRQAVAAGLTTQEARRSRRVKRY